MIVIVLGTKAQYIKMLPILTALRRRSVPFTIIDTGQHLSITREFRKSFGLSAPALILHTKGDVTSFTRAFFWSLRVMVLGFWRYRAHLHRGDYCLVHGDTLSTLFGMVMGLLCRARVVHIEAGERTHKLFRPFPEEIVRRVVDRYAALCFTSSDTAFANLAAEKLAHKSINVRHNTVLDSVRQVIDTPREIDLPERYALVSIHRVETVCSEPRMRVVCETARLAAKTRPVIWGMHPLTKQHLMRQGLYDELADDKRIITRDLFTYVEFIKAIDGAEFIVTDGGGPQEESYLLNTPCLLMRTETEREYHHNVFRAGFDRDAIEGFLDSPERFRMKEKPVVTSPTEEILRHLLSSTSRETP